MQGIVFTRKRNDFYKAILFLTKGYDFFFLF
jgi:hypothetical protein